MIVYLLWFIFLFSILWLFLESKNFYMNLHAPGSFVLCGAIFVVMTYLGFPLSPACTIDRDSRSIAILGAILMLLLREQITTFWRLYLKKVQKKRNIAFFIALFCNIVPGKL